MIEIPSADYYRTCAAELRKKAEQALSREMRTSYLNLAADWDRLAHQAEDATERPPAKADPAPKL